MKSSKTFSKKSSQTKKSSDHLKTATAKSNNNKSHLYTEVRKDEKHTLIQGAVVQDREMKNVPYPATNRLTSAEVFDSFNKPRIEVLRNHFYNEGRLSEEAARKIISMTMAVLASEENLLKINKPVTIVGDIHGQYYDLLSIFEHGGKPGETQYLFLGDYVDRGNFSMEVVLYLYSLKLVYQNSIFLLRGNHECRHLTEYFTFKKECLIKYSEQIYVDCTNSFDALPLAAVVNEQFFCVHGGISPELASVSSINRSIDRFQEIPQRGIMCDFLWSDPHPDFENDSVDKQAKKNSDKYAANGFLTNATRGCSFYYTHHAVTEFLEKNKLLSLIRAHEAQDFGFRTYKKDPHRFPAVMTVFSAPNYLDVYNNKGAVIVYDGETLNVKQYTHKPHPYWLPNFMDVFTWSLPFIAEKIFHMFYTIFNYIQEDETLERREIVKKKIVAIARVMRIYAKIARESEALVKLNGIMGPKESPLSYLVNLTGSRKSSIEEAKKKLGDDFKIKRRLSFDDAKILDLENEQMPQPDRKKSSLF